MFLVFLTALLIASNSSANAISSGEWSFDYKINGPRESRPLVFGDQNEMYLQFFGKVKPTLFLNKACTSKKSFRITPEHRGPYYVVNNPGSIVYVKTSHGKFTIKNDLSCKSTIPPFENTARSVASNSKGDIKNKTINQANSKNAVSKNKWPISKTNSNGSKMAAKKNAVAKNGKSSTNDIKQKKPKKIEYIMTVRKDHSIWKELSKSVEHWGMNLTWNLSRDRISKRHFVFRADSPNKVIDKALKAFRLNGWYAADTNTVYISKGK